MLETLLSVTLGGAIGIASSFLYSWQEFKNKEKSNLINKREEALVRIRVNEQSIVKREEFF